MNIRTQLLLSMSVLTGMLSSCGNSEPTAAKTGKEPIISDSTMQLLTIDTVLYRNINDEVKLSGEVSFDENKVVKVYPFSSGQVLNVNVSIGDHVNAGQVLATIKSADIAGNYADLSVAGNDVAIAKRTMENAEHLFKNGISTYGIGVFYRYGPYQKPDPKDNLAVKLVLSLKL